MASVAAIAKEWNSGKGVRGEDLDRLKQDFENISPLDETEERENPEL